MSPILDSIGSVKSYGWGAIPLLPGAYESIASATGTGSSGTITFSSIPSTYQYLQIRGIFRSDAGAQLASLGVQFNSVGGAPYARHFIEADGSGISLTGNTAQTAMGIGAVAAGSLAANIVSSWIIDIHDYASSTKSKTVRTLGGNDANGSGYVYISSGLLPATDAITSVTLILTAGSFFTTATRVALYGIKGA